MGKCSKCGKKIQYNQFKKIDGVVYCLDCKPKEKLMGFSDPPKIMLDEALTVALGEPLKMTIEPRVCKFCGAKNSSNWLKLVNGEWCCKRRACRKKIGSVTFQKHYPYEAED
jgi:hypothetical protein